MAARDLRILIKTLADVSGLTRLGQAVRGHSAIARGFGQAYRAAAATARAGFNLLGRELRMIRNVALGVAGAITGIAIKGVRSFMRQDDAAQKLAASLRSLGYDSDTLMPRFVGLANELQKLTRVGDDETLSLASMLLNFGIMPDKIDDAVRSTIGLSTALNMDLGRAAQYTAMALEGNTEMLRRYIPALRNTEDELEQAAIVQGVMNSGFQQAIELAGTLSGRWDQLKNRVGDLWERVGQSVDEALNLSAVFARIESSVNTLIDSDVWERITGSIRAVAVDSIAQIRTVWDLIQHLRDADFGIARMVEVGRTVIAELITLAVTLLLAQLRAATAVFVGLGKIIAASIKEEILNLNLPGTQRGRREAAERALNQMSEEDARQFLLANSPMTEPTVDHLAQRESLTDYIRKNYLDGKHNIQGQSALAAFSSPSQMQTAYDQAQSRISNIGTDISDQWDQSAARIKESTLRASGGEFDWDERAAAHRKTVDDFVAPVVETTDEDRRMTAVEVLQKHRQVAADRETDRRERMETAGPSGKYGYEAGMRTAQQIGGQIERAMQQLMEADGERLSRILDYLENHANDMRQIDDRIRRLPL